MPALFITASGTHAGKTFFAAALLRQWRAAGRPVHVLKPVASGCDPHHPETSDTFLLAHAAGLEWNATTQAAISPWRFAAPLSPHLASRREGRAIPTEELLDFCHEALAVAAGETLVIVEGAGGVLTPVNDALLMADWIAALGIPAVLLLESCLGGISHGLTALESLERRAIPLAGIFVREAPAERADAVPVQDTLHSIRRFARTEAPIHALPHCAGSATLNAPFPDLIRLLRL
jgi:dethiobiotin synthetase